MPLVWFKNIAIYFSVWFYSSCFRYLITYVSDMNLFSDVHGSIDLTISILLDLNIDEKFNDFFLFFSHTKKAACRDQEAKSGFREVYYSTTPACSCKIRCKYYIMLVCFYFTFMVFVPQIHYSPGLSYYSIPIKML